MSTQTTETTGPGRPAPQDVAELRRTTLERQYTALETALSSMQSQSSWLSSQISSLPSY